MSDQLYYYNERGYQQSSRIGADGATNVAPPTPDQVPVGKANRFDGDEWIFDNPDPGAGGGSGGGAVAAADRELLVTVYRATAAFTGASQNDIISATRMMDVTGSTAVQVGATSWFNETTGQPLVSAPNNANIEFTASPGLSNAQLRAAPVQMEGTVAMGAAEDASKPLKMGAVTFAYLTNYGNSSMPNNTRRNLVVNDLGALWTTVADPTGNPLGSFQTNNTDTVGANSRTLPTMAYSMVFNGNSWDRTRGDTHGTWMQGNVASGTADAGNPVKVGGVARSGPNDVQAAQGQRMDLSLNSNGSVYTQLCDGNGNSVNLKVGTSDTFPPSVPSLPVLNLNLGFNQTTGYWERIRATAASGMLVNTAGETYSSITILNQQTAAAGASFSTFANTPCKQLDIVNNSGADIVYQRNGAGGTMRVPNGSSRMVQGITNANQIGIRRLDSSNTQVTVDAEAFVI